MRTVPMEFWHFYGIGGWLLVLDGNAGVGIALIAIAAFGAQLTGFIG